MERQISRRTLLRSTATLTTGIVAARTVTLGAAEEAAAEPAAIAHDHDPATGEIADRDRPHHWETV